MWGTIDICNVLKFDIQTYIDICDNITKTESGCEKIVIFAPH